MFVYSSLFYNWFYQQEIYETLCMKIFQTFSKKSLKKIFEVFYSTKMPGDLHLSAFGHKLWTSMTSWNTPKEASLAHLSFFPYYGSLRGFY